MLLAVWTGRDLFCACLTHWLYPLQKALTFVLAVRADNLFAQKGAGIFIRSGIILVAGLVHLFIPKKIWDWEYGHKFKDKQPTPAILLLYRICGGIAIIISVILFLRGLPLA